MNLGNLFINNFTYSHNAFSIWAGTQPAKCEFSIWPIYYFKIWLKLLWVEKDHLNHDIRDHSWTEKYTNVLNIHAHRKLFFSGQFHQFNNILLETEAKIPSSIPIIVCIPLHLLDQWQTFHCNRYFFAQKHTQEVFAEMGSSLYGTHELWKACS